MRVLVTGGAGFLGSHLCERLVATGHEVLCYDSLLTGNEANIASLLEGPRFMFREYDVTKYLEVGARLDWIMHFASPASPIDYFQHPIHTLKLGALGTLNCLGLARAQGAGFFLASTSEVYGDPLVNPQPESYWGNVNPLGPRGVYDEAKRFAEAMTMAYHQVHDIPVRIVRIFNTYGPRFRRRDGRAVPTFISQALSGEPITVHGDGSQTRS
ncbi:MAG: NAD-dependent epimerase/dehydratase family protein, partial [Actinomycetota bacterium]